MPSSISILVPRYNPPPSSLLLAFLTLSLLLLSFCCASAPRRLPLTLFTDSDLLSNHFSHPILFPPPPSLQPTSYQSALTLLHEIEQARQQQRWADMHALAARLPSSDVQDHEGWRCFLRLKNTTCFFNNPCPPPLCLGLRALLLGEATLERCLSEGESATDGGHTFLVAQRYLSDAQRKAPPGSQDAMVRWSVISTDTIQAFYLILSRAFTGGHSAAWPAAFGDQPARAGLRDLQAGGHRCRRGPRRRRPAPRTAVSLPVLGLLLSEKKDERVNGILPN